MIEAVVRHVEAGNDLPMEQMVQTIESIMEGRWSEEQTARLLLALHEKGETVEEVAGAATALRRQVTPIRSPRRGILDTCGTGGDGSRTFNISTTAALVVAAAGVPVAKHGNRAITSRSGSADALAALGVNIEADVARVEACLDELGICFCFAPLLHRAMKHVAPVRRKLGVPTIFNILGPLVNPAQAEFQLLGVGHAGLETLMAEALALLGVRRAVVVHGEDGLDEVTLGGATRATETCEGVLHRWVWNPEDFGLAPCSLDCLRVSGPEESAAMIRKVLRGERGPARDVVVANAAAALWAAGRGETVHECAQQCAAVLDSGESFALLNRLVEVSRR